MADDEEERRHLSPDSSTQVLQRERHKHKKKKKHRHKSKKRKRRYSDVEEENSESERKSTSSYDSSTHCDENTVNELVLDVKPLTEYVEDRKELNEELFTIMGRKEMKRLLPKSIRSIQKHDEFTKQSTKLAFQRTKVYSISKKKKKMDVDELKSRCLDQLEIMSKKRLLKVIEGREMSSSSSESEHEQYSKNAAPASSVQQDSRVTLCEPPAEIAEIQDDPVNILEELSGVPDQHEIDELIEGATKSVEKTVDAESQEHPKEAAVDTESQLLELEYRARALKSMVKAQQSRGVTM